MLGVVACEALYNRIERHVPDASVRYVSPTRHEFPVNVPDEGAVATALQRAIDRVDGPDLDRIVVVYADDGESLRGLHATHAPLVVARETDCISTLLEGPAHEETGERRASGTYYLSRGWIDCAVDSYKLYCAYTGREADLLDEFERGASTRPDVRVTWNEGDLYERAVELRERVTDDQVGRFVHQIVGFYDRVHLLDTGDLYGFHREYAERFRAFIERLSREHGDDRQVELTTIDADDARLRTLLSADATDGASTEFEVYPPETPVE